MWTIPETTTVGIRVIPLVYAALPGIIALCTKNNTSTVLFGTAGLLFTLILAQTVGGTELFSLKLYEGAPAHCYALNGHRLLPFSTLVYVYWVSFFTRSFAVRGTGLYNLPMIIVGLAMGTIDWLLMIKYRCYRFRETFAAVVLASVCGIGWNTVVERQTSTGRPC